MPGPSIDRQGRVVFAVEVTVPAEEAGEYLSALTGNDDDVVLAAELLGATSGLDRLVESRNRSGGEAQMVDTKDWTESIPWQPGDAATHPSLQRKTDEEIEALQHGAEHDLQEAEGFTYEQAEAAGEDLDAYRESIRERIATYERALELRENFLATAKEAR